MLTAVNTKIQQLSDDRSLFPESTVVFWVAGGGEGCALLYTVISEAQAEESSAIPNTKLPRSPWACRSPWQEGRRHIHILTCTVTMSHRGETYTPAPRCKRGWNDFLVTFYHRRTGKHLWWTVSSLCHRL